MGWTDERLFKLFLAEHRSHPGLTTDTPHAHGDSGLSAACGCGAFFESLWTSDGKWFARIARGACPTR
jgi:hypothetical protein